MTKFERIRSVLQDKRPDRSPFSFWHHFSETQREGSPAIEAHRKHFEKYDVDFLKVMNDLPYPIEANSSGWKFNHQLFTELRGDEGSFGKHLEVIRGLKACLGRHVPLITTLFGPWTVLRRYLMAPHLNIRGVPSFGLPAAEVDVRINQLILDRPFEMERTFAMIAKSLSNFARKCIEAGASGVYFSVRKDWPNLGHPPLAKTNTYEDFVLPFDRLCLSGADDGWFNMLHICGEFHKLAEFSSLPTHAVHWADRITGPSLQSSVGKTNRALCGGIDNLQSLSALDPAKLIREISDVIQLKTPLIIAPGCAYDARAAHVRHLQMIRQLVSEKTSTVFENLSLAEIQTDVSSLSI